MAKTFILSPILGGIAAVLGWIGAVVSVELMEPATFESLQFGWTGLMVGLVALSALVVALLASGMIDPLILTCSAAVGAALLWNRRELPFRTDNFQSGDTSAYWFSFTMMAIVFVLLLMGLRAARESSTRTTR